MNGHFKTNSREKKKKKALLAKSATFIQFY